MHSEAELLQLCCQLARLWVRARRKPELRRDIGCQHDACTEPWFITLCESQVSSLRFVNLCRPLYGADHMMMVNSSRVACRH